MRNRKALGLGLAVAIAIAALSGLAGLAGGDEGPPTFTVDSEPTTMVWEKLKDEGAGKINAFTVIEKEILCKKAAFSGEIAKTGVTEISVTPVYSECETEAGKFVTVNHNECKYVFHIETKVAENHYEGLFDVSCPEGKAFEVKIFSDKTETVTECTIKVNSQAGLKKATYTNLPGAEKSKDGFKLEGTIGGIIYETEGKCGNLGFNNGIRHFHMAVTGKDAQNKNSGIRLSGG